MCLSSPRIPQAPAPVLTPPEAQKRMELNPALTKASETKSKKMGTRKLQIPLGGTGGGTGLNIGDGTGM